MTPRIGQDVRIKGTRGLWRITEFMSSPSRGPCAKLWRDGQSRIIPLTNLVSKSRRELEVK